MGMTFQIGDKVTPIEDTIHGNPRPLRKGEVMTVIDVRHDYFLTLVHSDGVRTKGCSTKRRTRNHNYYGTSRD